MKCHNTISFSMSSLTLIRPYKLNQSEDEIKLNIDAKIGRKSQSDDLFHKKYNQCFSA